MSKSKGFTSVHDPTVRSTPDNAHDTAMLTMLTPTAITDGITVSPAP